MDEVIRNRETQSRLYGEPLSTLLRRSAGILSLTQTKMAELLGISAPMLSQLINGHRVKLGNPAAVQRLQLLRETGIEVEAGRLSLSEAVARLESNRSSDVFTTTQREEAPLVRQMQELFRAIAQADDYAAAAHALLPRYPGIAELLRVYGAEPTEQALAHYRRTRHSRERPWAST